MPATPEIRGALGASELLDGLDARPLAGPVRLVIEAPSWSLAETFADPAAARARAREVAAVDPAANVVPIRPALARPLDPGLLRPESRRLEHAFAAWERGRGRLDQDMLRAFNRLGLMQRALILTPRDDTGRLHFRFIGLNYARRFGPAWVRDRVGMAQDADALDPSYTGWVAAETTLALATDTPKRDDVDARYRPPGTARAERFQYERLLLPVRDPRGRPLLISFSELRPGLLALTP